jgi:hypothetical protein
MIIAMNRSLTNVLLFTIAMLLVADLCVSVRRGARAASMVRVQTVSKPGAVDITGDVVGFSCVNKGAYTECSIASK